MLTWYRRLKLGFDVTSKITAPKLPVRNPVPIINHNNQSSKLTPRSNHPIRSVTNVSRISSLSVHRTTSCFRRSGSCYRCYHVDRHYDPPKILYIVVVVGFGIGVAICFGNVETIPYTHRKHLVVMPYMYERKIGVRMFEKKKARYKERVLPKTHPESVRVRMILKDVVEALHRDLKREDLNYASENGAALMAMTKKGVKLATSHLEGLEWEVLVVKNDIVNAYCLPGGKIVVFTGILKHFKTDEEIATIIGHEVAHVVARHAVERFTKNIWLVLGQLILYEFVNPDLVDISSVFLLDLPFSRRMEIEADHIGVLLMASAGYDPRGAPKVYKKLGQKALDDYVSTHPSGKTRCKLLSEASLMQEAISIYKDAIARREIDA
ncbi:putative peptidase M48 [Helianthus annuus]|nr:putative peptidase M48 [Helianthus annuus]